MENLRSENSLSADATIPTDLVEMSASGLEGYIYMDSAMIQVSRIASARNISEAEVKKLSKIMKKYLSWGLAVP